MKIALLLLVAVIMMMGQEVNSRRKYRARIRVRPIHGGRRHYGFTRGCCGCNCGFSGYKRYGKREVSDADFIAAYNAAAEDGVFTDEEIQSVFDVGENVLAEFKRKFDVNGDGKVTVEEFEKADEASSDLNPEE